MLFLLTHLQILEYRHLRIQLHHHLILQTMNQLRKNHANQWLLMAEAVEKLFAGSFSLSAIGNSGRFLSAAG